MEEQQEHSNNDTNIEVSLVIPTYNRSIDLKLTLDFLAKQTCQDFEVLVIDNSSSDDTSSMIKSVSEHWQGRLRYYIKAPNGPASARNLGINKSQKKWVLFLDSDVGLHPEWIEKALLFMKNNKDAAAAGGAVVYDFDHTRVNAFGGDIGLFGLAWDEQEDTLLADLQKPELRMWANCSAMIADRAKLLEVGGFDERFFYGYEDSDIGWKMNITGAKIYVLPDLIAYHRVQPEPGFSNAVIVRHYCKNRLSSLIQNSSAMSLLFRILLYFVYSSIDLIFRGPRIAKLQGIWWNVKNLPETLQRRKLIQSKRKSNDNQIFSLGKKRMFPPKPLNGHRRRPVHHQGEVKAVANSNIDDRV